MANPERLKSQVEGAAVMGCALAMYGEITFKNGRAMQTNFDKYKVTRIPESPTATEVFIVKHGLETPSSGVGEPPLPPFAPALCNAIYNAVGKRIRHLPIGDQIKAQADPRLSVPDRKRPAPSPFFSAYARQRFEKPSISPVGKNANWRRALIYPLNLGHRKQRTACAWSQTCTNEHGRGLDDLPIMLQLSIWLVLHAELRLHRHPAIARSRRQLGQPPRPRAVQMCVALGDTSRRMP
jgi:Molybdopterin-binding domain of aldehyde dehydrogenase